MSFFNRLRGKSVVETGTSNKDSSSPPQAKPTSPKGGSAPAAAAVPPANPAPPPNDQQQGDDPAAAPSVSHSPADDAATIAKLRDENKSLQQQLQNKCQEYVDHMHSINEELATKDRGLKRAESLAREATRAREKQIVQHSTEVTRLRNELAAAQEKICLLEKNIVEDDTKYQSLLMKLKEEEQNVLAVKSQTQMILESRTNLITELTKVSEDLKQQNITLKAQLAQCEKKLIEAVTTAQSKDSELLAMRVALESERRLAQAKSRAAAKRDPSSVDGGNPAAAAADDEEPAEAARRSTGDDGGAAAAASADVAANQQVIEAVRHENVLRAKDKQIIALTNELIALRSDVKLKQLSVSTAQEESQQATNKLSVVSSALAEARQQLTVACQQLEHKSETNAELRRIKVEQEEQIVALQQLVSGMEIEVERLRGVEEYHINFVGQHTNCHSTMSEGALRIMKLQGELKDLRESAARVAKERDTALESVRDAQHRYQLLQDEKDLSLQPKMVRIAALESDLQKVSAHADELAALLKTKDAEFAKLATELSAVTAQRDEERELWRQRATQSSETLAQHVASTTAQVQLREKREAELAKQIETLSAERDELLTTKRQLEARLREAAASGAVDSSTNERRTTALQRMSLELEEMKQKHAKLLREVQSKKEEVENMRNRLCEAEGSVDQSSLSTAKRVVGMLESLSVEVSSQLADHLRLDYLRGGKASAAMLVRTFNLMQDQAQELVEVLCELFLLVKIGSGLEDICRRLGVKENSIRRIVTAFSKVEQRFTASPRHELLIRDTLPKQRTTYCGGERLGFLCIVHREGSPLAVLQDHPYILAKICAFLPMVIRGSNTFAAHNIGKRSQGDLVGHTILVCLEPSDRTFKMLECEVSMNRTMMVIVDGKYKTQLSPNSMSNVKLMMQCRVKRDAVLVSKSGGQYEWNFGEEEAIPRQEADIITYSIKWELNHDGLVAETSNLKVREVSAAEVGLLKELYAGDLSPTQMLHHRSWELIPPPPSAVPAASSPATGPKTR